jgi:hypothetical protein
MFSFQNGEVEGGGGGGGGGRGSVVAVDHEDFELNQDGQGKHAHSRSRSYSEDRKKSSGEWIARSTVLAASVLLECSAAEHIFNSRARVL